MITCSLLAVALLAQTPEELDKLRLPVPLRVEFTVKQGSRLTVEQMKPALDAMAKDMAEQYKKYKMSEDAVEQQMKSIRARYEGFATPKQYHLVFVTDGTKYFYQQEPEGEKPDVFKGDNADRMTMMYDGVRTYTIMGNGHQVMVDAGPVLHASFLLPFPGIGLPQFPMAKPLGSEPRFPANKPLPTPPEGYVLCTVGSSTRVASEKGVYGYSWGMVKAKTVEGQWQVERMTRGVPGNSLEEWEFSDPFTFGGKRVARTTLRNNFMRDENRKVMKDAIQFTESKITKISGDPLAASIFELKTYIAEKQVLIADQRASRRAILFYFDPKLTLDEQLEKHKNDPPGVITDGG